MKFHCERDVLLEALSVASRAVTGRGGTLPVLSGVRLEVEADRLYVTGSDLDLTIRVQTEVKGDAGGVCVIPARTVTEITRALEPGAVTIDSDDEEARLSSGRYQSSLRALPAADFPRVATLTGRALTTAGAETTTDGDAGAGVVTLDVGDVGEALRQVVRAASSDDARPILTGVLMTAEEGGLRLVATDSYRLAVRDLPGRNVLGEGQQVLVPAKALAELQRLLSSVSEVDLSFGEHDATFDLAGVRLTTRLIEGEFPNYRQLIPSSYPNRLVVDKDEIQGALRRVRLLARDATTPVRMALRPESIELSVVTNDVGQASEEVDAKYEGSDITVAFNPGYLVDGIEATSGDEVSIETIDALRPAIVRSTSSQEFLYLLMPVRVS
ncbi:MAG: DNA polymerase III subunit beta [Actinomycetota bacterium]|nr:DNA polymerase III subunit beta [Actinomycetota bacterium]MDQ3573344.1 DNA polymerase III subunit beta [Actinomycetota bacterium]